MKKGLKIFLIILAVVVVLAFIYLWINGFEISRFIPRKGYA